LRHLAFLRGPPTTPAGVSLAHVASSAPSRASTPRSAQRLSAASAQSLVVRAAPIQRPASPMAHVWSPRTSLESNVNQDISSSEQQAAEAPVAQQFPAVASRQAASHSRDCSPLWARPVTALAPGTPSKLVMTPQTAPTQTQQNVPVAHQPRMVPADSRDVAQQQPSPARAQHYMLPTQSPAAMAPQSQQASQQLRAITPSSSRAGTPGPMRGSPPRVRSEPGQKLAEALAAAAGVMAVDVDLASLRPGCGEEAVAAAAPTAAGETFVEPSGAGTLPRRVDKPGVCVPQNHKAGQPIAIRTAAGLVLLPLPPGARPGDEIAFEVEELPPALTDYGRGPDGIDSDDGNHSSCGDSETDVMTLCGTVRHELGLPHQPPAGHRCHTPEAPTSAGPSAPPQSPMPPSLHPAAPSSLPPRSPMPPSLRAAAPSSLPRARSSSRAAQGSDWGPCSPPPRSVPSPSPAPPSPVSNGPEGQCRKATTPLRAERGPLALPPPLQVPELGRLRVAPPPPPPPLSSAAMPVASMYPESPLLDRRTLLHTPGAMLSSALPPHSGPSSPPGVARTTAVQEAQPAMRPPGGRCAPQRSAVPEPSAPADMQSERAERRRLRAHRTLAGAAALDDEELLEELSRRRQLSGGQSTSQSCSYPAASKVAVTQHTASSNKEQARVAAPSSSSVSPPASPPRSAARSASAASLRTCRAEAEVAEPQLRCAGRSGAGAPPPPDVQEQREEEPRTSPKDCALAGQAQKGRAPSKLQKLAGGAGRLPPPPNCTGVGPSQVDHRSLQPPFGQPIDIGLDGFASVFNLGAPGLSAGFDPDRVFSGCSGPTPTLASAHHTGLASWDLPAPPPQWLTGRPSPPGCAQSNAHCLDGRASPQQPGSCLRGGSEQAMATKLYHRFGLDGCISFERFAAQLAANKEPRASPACGGA